MGVSVGVDTSDTDNDALIKEVVSPKEVGNVLCKDDVLSAEDERKVINDDVV